jgi:hypothetical protein
MDYTYRYSSWEGDDEEEATAMALLNYNESLKMDVLRSTMGPRSEELRARVLDHERAHQLLHERRDNGGPA